MKKFKITILCTQYANHKFQCSLEIEANTEFEAITFSRAAFERDDNNLLVVGCRDLAKEYDGEI